MKVLSVIPTMGTGGAEVVAATLARDMVERGHRVQLASSGGFRADGAAAHGVELVDVPMTGRSPRELTGAVRRLRGAAGRLGPDLVTCHNVKATLVARIGVGRRVPVVTTLHGVPPEQLPAAARILRHTADHVVAVSPHVAGQLAGQGFPAERISTIENAVVPPPVHDRATARDELGLAPERPVAVCLARLVPQKRHDILLRAWARVAGEPLLLLAGDGPNRPGLEALAAELGITDRVLFLGERTDVDRLLAAADLSVLSTDWEGMPISMLEAMGLGLPVVVTRVGGVVETLGEAVRLVEPGSVESLVRALDELIGDRALRSGIGLRGRALVNARFGPTTMLDAYDDLHRRITTAARPVSSR
ncbi:glycosyltransferase involved in cell wall biosynthesis [Nocardioides daedukensis]|uniref:Glycosyltransferase involved in cell wall biosynthesis n=1 Tax=Nocardioides daedukensis TaxID=634462 RepID=A0A7Y9S316_9ACTN|nr:glycosyltransferase [Nocardioides daedukensis]NYG58550.1 glycosyltransferase involved in cell wall biosynthesis [Nocardioides daedukensis]